MTAVYFLEGKLLKLLLCDIHDTVLFIYYCLCFLSVKDNSTVANKDKLFTSGGKSFISYICLQSRYAVQTQPPFVTKSPKPLFFMSLQEAPTSINLVGIPTHTLKETYIERNHTDHLLL
ncbi:Glucan endo-1,3-beta-glucosidase 3 [Zea mays]|jgi:hypothetical protein|uniref:Glucan endo-1,3-beta-glucosidase 3 n=1 Tax=Zea mays TaxID=4577 RepID=A0A1D6ICM5_MAIZE|nr:Glucan endo-1,3-beta-glucosidase 3 [Zea mays]